MAITLNTTGGGLIIRTSSQRWFNGLGTNHISKIRIFQTESGQTSSVELKSFDVDINDNQIIMIKIPKEDLSRDLFMNKLSLFRNGRMNIFRFIRIK